MHESPPHALRPLIVSLNEGRVAAEEHVAALLALSPASWDAWLADAPHARTWLFLEAILDVAYAALDDDLALALAATAFVLRHLDSTPVPPEAEDLFVLTRSRAWRERGNALRPVDPRAALDAFETAASILEDVPPAEPEYVMAKRGAALILADRGQTEEALAIIRHSAGVLRRCNDIRGTVHSQLYEGVVLHNAGRHAEACAVWQDALRTAEEMDDEETASRLHNNLGHCARLMADASRSADHLSRARDLFEKYGMSTDALRALDGESELLADDGDIVRALAVMENVREGFAANGRVLDAAGAELDMLELHSLAHPGPEAYHRAAELVVLFSDAGVLREALRANALVQSKEAGTALSTSERSRLAAAVRRLHASP